MSKDSSPHRQQLTAKISQLDQILKPAFERDPVFPGNLNISKHRCGNEACCCTTQGKLHQATRLQIRFQDGIANRCLSPEEVAFFKPRIDAFRRIRKVKSALRKWEKEILGILDAIEHSRRSLEGLSEEDAERPLR